MAKSNEAPVTNAAASDDETGVQWTSDEVPRLSMGEGTDKKGNKRLTEFRGKYLYSIKQRIKRRMTVMHRFSTAKGDEVLVYGSGAINAKLSLLPSGTLVRLTYLGEVDTGQDTPMKNIKVEWPKGVKLLDKAPAPIEREPGADDEGDEPF